MGDVVNFPIAIDSDLGRELVIDCCRFTENILTEPQVRKKYRFTNDDWEALGKNDSLVEKIEEEKQRRIRDGSAKREKSQKLVVAAPDVLSGILLDNTANAKHRIDSAKTLSDFAANGPEAATAGTRFLIQINMGADTLSFNKSIRPLEPGEIDPDDSSPDTGMIAAITAKKTTDGGNGNAI